METRISDFLQQLKNVKTPDDRLSLFTTNSDILTALFDPTNPEETETYRPAFANLLVKARFVRHLMENLTTPHRDIGNVVCAPLDSKALAFGSDF